MSVRLVPRRPHPKIHTKAYTHTHTHANTCILAACGCAPCRCMKWIAATKPHITSDSTVHNRKATWQVHKVTPRARSHSLCTVSKIPSMQFPRPIFLQFLNNVHTRTHTHTQTTQTHTQTGATVALHITRNNSRKSHTNTHRQTHIHTLTHAI